MVTQYNEILGEVTAMCDLREAQRGQVAVKVCVVGVRRVCVWGGGVGWGVCGGGGRGVWEWAPTQIMYCSTAQREERERPA